MQFTPETHHGKSNRLPDYDYSLSGLYFITICTHERLPLFGKIIDGIMITSDAGVVVEKCWREIPDHFPQVMLDGFVLMPNHIHGIIEIVESNENVVGANNYSPTHSPLHSPLRGTSKTVGSIVRGFKIGVTKWFRENTDIHKVWQRNYHEHVIRDEEGYAKISEYIQYNPQKWQDDTYHTPNRTGE